MRGFFSLPAEVKREGGDERVSYTLWHKCTGEGGRGGVNP